MMFMLSLCNPWIPYDTLDTVTFGSIRDAFHMLKISGASKSWWGPLPSSPEAGGFNLLNFG